MATRVTVRVIGVALVTALANSVAVGYIHFPPMTLQRLCKSATHIRVLSIEKYEKERGIVVFEVVESLKGQNPRITSFRHVVRTDAEGVQPMLDWLGDGKRAVMFSIENDTIACGYVFIDNYCYSVDHNKRGQYWQMIRAEPNMSACYHGTTEQLHKLTRELLDGKNVKVPVKPPASPETKEDRDKRIKEVTDILTKNRK